MYLGILEEQKRGNYEGILVLLGSQIIDSSVYKWGVSSNGVTISNNSYYFNPFSGTSRATIGSASNSIFYFSDQDFSIELEFQLTSHNATDGISVFCGSYAATVAHTFNQYYFAILNTNQLVFRYQNTNNIYTSATTNTLPDTDFLTEFVQTKVERIGTNLNFYYKNNLIFTHNIGATTFRNVSSPAAFLGAQRSTGFGNYFGYIKNFFIKRPGF